jgi:pimeloyl-ACP methyl ester carboxylesterase
VGRECEDIEALVKEVGGAAALFGSSSGAALALAAAASGVGVDALALFEPPFVVQEGDRRPPADLGSRVDELVATGRPGKAVNAFMTEAIGMPAIAVRLMRLMPRTWAKLEAMAPTIRYDLTIMAGTQDGGALPRERWASVAAPTLVLDGGKSPAGMRHAASALADVLPNARHRTVEGVSHGAVVMAPKKLAPLLREFFRA